MKKTIESVAAGKTVISFGVTDEMRDSIAEWAARQTDTPTLSDAAHRLVELALSSARAPRFQPAKM